MNIIIINPKKDFSDNQIGDLESVGQITWIEDDNYQDDPAFTNDEEKIVAIGPEVVGWKFDNDFIDKITNLKSICIPSSGFDWVDGSYLREKEVTLTNVPKYSTESVAECAISMMFNVAKKLPLIIKNGWKLDYDTHQGWEIKGKTMGVIGLGSIGTRIAEIGQQIGMNVVYWSKNSRDDRFEYLEFDDVLKTSDYIFPTLLKNNETKNMVNKDRVGLIKNGASIVSITGDELFDLASVLLRLKEGSLNGLAIELDDKTINDFEGNVWVAPHISWFTKEAFDEDIKIWVDNIIAAAKGQPKDIVN